jgi:2-polyprenyl-3-methyl-5-hydroxy-6-metoxy-1,4-benzoquinol methylase
MARIPLVQRVDYLKTICRGKTVLHLGCSDYPYTADRVKKGSLLHLVLQDVAAELWGMDSDPAGLEALRSLGVKNLVHADLEHLERAVIDHRFDIILAGEVIEHLSNPGLFLRGIRKYMDQGTTLVLTTINAYGGLRAVIYALRGRSGVSEPVHPDHVAYYSYATLSHLIEREGLHIRKIFFYDIGREYRPFNKPYLNAINDVLVRCSHQLADGLIVECGI